MAGYLAALGVAAAALTILGLVGVALGVRVGVAYLAAAVAVLRRRRRRA